MSAPGFLQSYLPYLLQKADHLLSADMHNNLSRRFNLQVSEWRVLAVLADSGPVSVRQVGEIALLPQPTASHACRRLEDAGLVSREESQDDRRVRIMALTDPGSALVDELTASAGRFEQDMLADLAIDREALVDHLRVLIAELEQREPTVPNLRATERAAGAR